MIFADCEKEFGKKGSCDPLEDFALMHYLWKHVHVTNNSIGCENMLNKQPIGINYQQIIRWAEKRGCSHCMEVCRIWSYQYT